MTRAIRLAPVLVPLLLCGFATKPADGRPAAAAAAAQPQPDPELDRLRRQLDVTRAEVVEATDKMEALRAELALKQAQVETIGGQNAKLQRRLARLDGQAAAATTGPALVGLAQLVEDRIAIDGAELHLAGVVIDRTRAERVATILDSAQREGSLLRCLHGAAGWSCRNAATGQDDLADLLAANGVATTTADADEALRQAEAKARAERRGLWASR
jgi:chromosome segregation ATPase